MDQGSTRKRSAVHNFAPTVTKFCAVWEGQALPHDTKFGNSRCKIVGRRVIFIWSLIHGSSWSGLIKAEPGTPFTNTDLASALISNYIHYKVWAEFTYPLTNSKGAIVEVWEKVSKFNPHSIRHVITYAYSYQNYVIPCHGSSKGGSTRHILGMIQTKCDVLKSFSFIQ